MAKTILAQDVPPVKVNAQLHVSVNEVVHPSLGKGGMFGLFNSIRALIGFALYCHESRIRLVLPTVETGFHSGAFHTFDELFVSERFIAAMAKVQVTVNERLPAGTRAWAGSRNDRVGMGRFTRYQSFLTRDLEAEANATTPSGSVADMFSRIKHMHPRSDPGLSYEQLAAVEGAVYSGLRPAARIARTVRHIQRTALANESYGCLHARIEKDIYAYHRYIGDGRPVQMATILRCDDACAQRASVRHASHMNMSTRRVRCRHMKNTPQLHAARRVYVATGPDSDIYAGEAARLSKPTPWGAQLVRHRANCTRVGGRCATYVELAQVDFEVCRQAAWFVGWRGSSFTQGVARFRALDSLPGIGRSWLSYCSEGLTSHPDAEALVGYYGRPCKMRTDPRR